MNDIIKTYDRQDYWRTFGMALTTLLVALLSIFLFASCVYDEYKPGTENFKSDTYINLSVITLHPESNIHSIRVWAFNSENANDNDIAIGYRKETLSTPINGESDMHSISIKLPRNTQTQENQHIDLYILANAESIGSFSLYGKEASFSDVFNEKSLTRKQLKELVIQNQFGITTDGKPQDTVVPSTGLPLSRVLTHISRNEHIAETETGAAAKAITVPLVRAVSKLHFFFARKAKASTENVEITKIEIDEQVLPMESRVFPMEVTEDKIETEGLIGYFPYDTQYIGRKMALEGIPTSNIKEVETPEALKRQEKETASAYMSRLHAATDECNLFYLRESNKPVTGTIFYKLNSSSGVKQATFNIPLSHRNTEMVVYGYFLDGGTADINLKYYVTAWNEKEETNIEFN